MAPGRMLLLKPEPLCWKCWSYVCGARSEMRQTGNAHAAVGEGSRRTLAGCRTQRSKRLTVVGTAERNWPNRVGAHLRTAEIGCAFGPTPFCSDKNP